MPSDDGKGRPLVMLLSEGRMSDYKGAALADRKIAACIPSKMNRKMPVGTTRRSIASATR
ncbi:hypothetical protein C1T17_01050 [Sphingobium sp. SCG-1]|nr:hypothetical protein C1T17_01050 [Sphingobium sp. SCG-1]